MTIDEILQKVLHSPTIPTLPGVAMKVISLSAKEDTGIREISNIISQDASLSAKILKIANSAYYSFPVKISTISQAVSRIGINAIRSLLLSFSFISMKLDNKSGSFNFENFTEKSIASAVAAKLLIKEIGKVDPEEVFTAALLQNIGELIIANAFSEQYEQIQEKLSKGKEDIIALEQEFVGADHALIGYEVAKTWCFPDILLIPMKYHHSPEKLTAGDKKLKLVTNVIHVSGLISKILYSDDSFSPTVIHKEFCDKAKSILGLSEETIKKISGQVHTEVEHIAHFLDLQITRPKSIEEILLEANTALSVVNMTYEQINREHVLTRVQLEEITKELEEKNKLLEKLINIDDLTETFNFRFLQTFLEKEVERAIRNKESISLIFFDIDYFKFFNDNYGHQIGDFILKEICQITKTLLREYDILARYGGEEFAVVLVETKKAEAQIIAERIRETIEKNAFIVNDNKYTVTASFGVAEIQPHSDNFNKDQLIQFADKALLESKNNGRNRTTLYKNNKNRIRFGENIFHND